MEVIRNSRNGQIDDRIGVREEEVTANIVCKSLEVRGLGMLWGIQEQNVENFEKKWLEGLKSGINRYIFIHI